MKLECSKSARTYYTGRLNFLLISRRGWVLDVFDRCERRDESVSVALASDVAVKASVAASESPCLTSGLVFSIWHFVGFWWEALQPFAESKAVIMRYGACLALSSILAKTTSLLPARLAYRSSQKPNYCRVFKGRAIRHIALPDRRKGQRKHQGRLLMARESLEQLGRLARRPRQVFVR